MNQCKSELFLSFLWFRREAIRPYDKRYLGIMSSGRSRGEAWGAHPPLFFDQSEAQWAKKNFFETGLPRPLSQRLDDCPFPPIWRTGSTTDVCPIWLPSCYRIHLKTFNGSFWTHQQREWGEPRWHICFGSTLDYKLQVKTLVPYKIPQQYTNLKMAGHLREVEDVLVSLLQCSFWNITIQMYLQSRCLHTAIFTLFWWERITIA